MSAGDDVRLARTLGQAVLWGLGVAVLIGGFGLWQDSPLIAGLGLVLGIAFAGIVLVTADRD